MLVSSWHKYLEGCLMEVLAELASQKCLLGNASRFYHICFARLHLRFVLDFDLQDFDFFV